MNYQYNIYIYKPTIITFTSNSAKLNFLLIGIKRDYNVPASKPRIRP